MEQIYLAIILAPLTGAIIAGLFRVSRVTAHRAAITGVGISSILSMIAFKHIVFDGNTYNATVYTWLVSGNIHLEIGFLIDPLSVTMMTVVSFVSWMIHIYTIGYMEHDDTLWSAPTLAGKYSYQRFFAYISLFTFSMLMLVMSNNFIQLFFGWEAVGVVSYLLIGFWFQRESAVRANLKAFLVNRVGDFGFLLGIAVILMYFNSLNYAEVFGKAQSVADAGTTMQIFSWAEPWSVITVACILLFVGAMGKSAQMPLHVWLPDSMEGPTPISALIHAATMVTAGIFMVARMSPLFELSETALSVVLVIGALTALFMGFLGLVQNDIKRVVAYSTISQLGYMTVALGASAYSAAIFHLMTHAFFKALMFLGAGSVIIAMHHEQDMRKMGGLKKYMPITYWTTLIGSLALIGFPGFAGFFSKDAIIEAAHHADRAGATFAYYAVLIGVFFTALYTFRMLFLTFHGKERMDEHTREHLHETKPVVTGPLMVLAFFSVIMGAVAVDQMLFKGFYRESIFVAAGNYAFTEAPHGVAGVVWIDFLIHGLFQLPLLLAGLGVFTAWALYIWKPEIPARIASMFSAVHSLLVNKYLFDVLFERLFPSAGRGVGGILWRVGDEKVIDGWMVNGSANTVGRISRVVRRIQTGYLYHYAFAMLIGLLVFLSWFVLINVA
ncbi:MAG: NADH-quinone oxidoreductase subunit L [Gammaproteobacteria bacterium]|nr:NADH-quinone oxidoreductase subunit L [Gammaproteobacteria bacterium]